MEISNNALRMLSLMERPAFIAAEGRILSVNTPAEQYHLREGMALDTLLKKNMAQYEALAEGCLSIAITVGEDSLQTTVQKMDGFDLFLLEPKEDAIQLRTLAMAAQQLRIPLASLINSLEGVSNPQAARSAHQLHRAVCNMSDAMRYRNYRKPDLNMQEVHGFITSVVESVTAYAEAAGVKITYTGLNTDLYCLIDQELLERAILNLISNSVKAGSSQIDVKLTRQKRTLSLSIQDNGKGVPTHLRSQMFSRFRRDPGLYNTGYGLGLGMVIIQAAASAHNGTVLMEHRPSGGLHTTLTLSIMEGESAFRSPALKIDYLGGMDHTLTELSDVLPDTNY